MERKDPHTLEQPDSNWPGQPNPTRGLDSIPKREPYTGRYAKCPDAVTAMLSIVGRHQSMKRLAQYRLTIQRIDGRHNLRGDHISSSVWQAALRSAGEDLIRDLQVIYRQGLK